LFKYIILKSSNNIWLNIYDSLHTSSKTFGPNNIILTGDICQRGFGSEPDYKCVKSVHCEPLIESIKSKSYLDICSFDGLHPIVCCPMAIGETSKPNVTIVNKSSLDRNPNNNSAVESKSLVSVIVHFTCIWTT